MRARIAVLVAFVAIVLVAWMLRSERAEVSLSGEALAEPIASSATLSADTQTLVGDEASSTRSALESQVREPESQSVLRVRVVETEGGATLRDCGVWLEFAGNHVDKLEELPDGSFEYRGSIQAGTDVLVQVPVGWEAARDRLELDPVPAEELVFQAQHLPAGPVHGIVVDEREGLPLPYQRLEVGGEKLLTDSRGAFQGVESHPRGTLEFYAGGWSYQLGDWDPERREPVIVPARVGPVVFLELDRIPEKASAQWSTEVTRPSATAISLHAGTPSRECRFDLQPIPRVQFSWRTSPSEVEGEVRVQSYPDFLFGRAALVPGLGSLEAPLPIALQPCGIVVVRAEFSRRLEEGEAGAISFALVDDAFEALGSFEPYNDNGFFVFEAGERRIEARLNGRTVASAAVSGKILEVVQVPLAIPLPEPEEAEEEPTPTELHPVTARVTSARNHHYPARLSIMRISDGEETLAEVKWTKEDGRWLGRVEDEVPGGAHRVQLELEPAFAWGGPRELEFPHAEELRFTIDDTAALVDVYLRPVAAEDGRPLLSFDGQALIESGDWIGGDEFCSPSVPIVRGCPRSVPFDWSCSAPGRRFVCGSFEPDGGEGDIVIPVVLQRGWGLRLYVGDNSHSGLPGVRVFGDGVPMGVTMRSGILCLGGERPERLSFEYEDWVPDPWSDVEPDGSFEDDPWGISVFLAPPERR